jgi:hypothetical protein
MKKERLEKVLIETLDNEKNLQDAEYYRGRKTAFEFILSLLEEDSK